MSEYVLVMVLAYLENKVIVDTSTHLKSYSDIFECKLAFSEQLSKFKKKHNVEVLVGGCHQGKFISKSYLLSK